MWCRHNSKKQWLLCPCFCPFKEAFVCIYWSKWDSLLKMAFWRLYWITSKIIGYYIYQIVFPMHAALVPAWLQMANGSSAKQPYAKQSLFLRVLPIWQRSLLSPGLLENSVFRSFWLSSILWDLKKWCLIFFFFWQDVVWGLWVYL